MMEIGYVKFKANNDQLRRMAANAINASSPVGMGFIHFKPKEYSPEEIKMPPDNDFYFDYYEGRMVKLLARKVDDGVYRMINEVRGDYQSWAQKYPDVASLLIESGITEFEFII